MRDLDGGHLSYTIYRSPDAYKAWEASKKVIGDHIDGAVAFDKHALEGALSGIVASFAYGEYTASTAATVSFINQVVHNQSKDYNIQFLNKVKEVSVDDLKNSLKEFLLPILGCRVPSNGGEAATNQGSFPPSLRSPSSLPYTLARTNQQHTLYFLLSNLACKGFDSIFGVCAGKKGKIVLCMIVCLPAVITEGG